MIDGLHMPAGIPGGLLELEARDLYRVLPGPTVLGLPGRRGSPLFTAVLQHGNETVGWDAVRSLLARYGNRELPRAWWIFIGNVGAARYGMRRLDSQPDFNRCWPGAPEPHTALHRSLAELTGLMRKLQPFASVDVHNNTGRNPHYAIVNSTQTRALNLASLFSRRALYFTIPNGVQSAAFDAFCPAVTVECGIVGDKIGTQHAAEFLDACLHLDHLPDHDPAPGDLFVYRTAVRLTIAGDVDFGYGDPTSPVNLPSDLDALNFHPLQVGTRLADVTTAGGSPVRAHDLKGRDVTDHYLAISNGELITIRPVTPSMLTRNALVVRQDCLGYLMEE